MTFYSVAVLSANAFLPRDLDRSHNDERQRAAFKIRVDRLSKASIGPTSESPSSFYNGCDLVRSTTGNHCHCSKVFRVLVDTGIVLYYCRMFMERSTKVRTCLSSTFAVHVDIRCDWIELEFLFNMADSKRDRRSCVCCGQCHDLYSTGIHSWIWTGDSHSQHVFEYLLLVGHQVFVVGKQDSKTSRAMISWSILECSTIVCYCGNPNEIVQWVLLRAVMVWRIETERFVTRRLTLSSVVPPPLYTF